MKNLLPTTSVASTRDVSIRCIVCHRTFDFAAGEHALVLEHTAYGFDFAHDRACLKSALGWIYVEPGYDRAAFSRGRERVRILRIAPADGWNAVIPDTPEQVLAGRAVKFEPLGFWALVEHCDGARRIEGIVRDAEWEDEPGGAEFSEARCGVRAWLDYASPAAQTSAVRRGYWAERVEGRYWAEAARADHHRIPLQVRKAA
jgi:hypothetical protein